MLLFRILNKLRILILTILLYIPLVLLLNDITEINIVIFIPNGTACHWQPKACAAMGGFHDYYRVSVLFKRRINLREESVNISNKMLLI